MANDLIQLYAQIQAAIDSALENEVAPVVKEEIQNAVNFTVYSAGEPNQYERRKEFGGLADINNMTHEVNNGILEVADNADFATGLGGVNLSHSLAYNIEFGYGERESWWNEERPFMESAKNVLQSSGKAREALKQGLEKSLGTGKVIVT